MPLSQVEYLRHILDEINFLESRKEGLSKDEFLYEETIKRAFTRSIEIIGEAAKKISDEIKNKYPETEWKAISGMRDRLIHSYFGIDYDIVWDVIQNKIPVLQKQIIDILNIELKK